MANSASGRIPHQNGPNDEDDFDFGNFEGGDLEPDVSEAPPQAQAAQWALFASGNGQGRPDLLCAQNRFPTYLDPSNISGASPGSGNPNLNNAVHDSSDLPPPYELAVASADDENLANEARLVEGVLDGTLNAAAANFRPPLANVNGRLPDIGLGTNDNQLFGTVPVGQGDLLQPVGASAESGLPDGQDQVVHQDLQMGNVLPQQGAEVDIGAMAQGGVDNGAENEHQEQKQDPSHEQARVHNLQQQLQELSERNRVLEEELEQSHNSLTAQRVKFEEAETRHSQDLEEMNAASRSTLAVIVDQYKEQSKVVVLEQQEQAQRRIVEAMNEQMEAFQGLLQSQRSKQEQEREEDREELNRQIASSSEASRVENQGKFETFLKELEEKHKAEMEKAVEAERANSKAQVEQAMQAEREERQQKLQEIRLEYSQMLEEERNRHEEALSRVRDEQSETFKEKMSELVSGERERGRSAVSEALEETRSQTRAYVDELRRADSRVRRRHLASLDVFLESARHQISLLQENESSLEQAPSEACDESSGENT